VGKVDLVASLALSADRRHLVDYSSEEAEAGSCDQTEERRIQAEAADMTVVPKSAAVVPNMEYTGSVSRSYPSRPASAFPSCLSCQRWSGSGPTWN
jgi:hypothetical protein